MSNNLWLEEDWLEVTGDGKRISLGNSDAYETFAETKSELYRSLQREYGRCTGKVYVDTKDGGTQEVGWVFQKRRRYEDCNDTYLAETWCTVYKSKPIKHVTYEVEYA